jgi:hypothetical protein
MDSAGGQDVIRLSKEGAVSGRTPGKIMARFWLTGLQRLEAEGCSLRSGPGASPLEATPGVRLIVAMLLECDTAFLEAPNRWASTA